MPQPAAYEQRSGEKPDTLFQTLSKHAGVDGRPKKTLRFSLKEPGERDVPETASFRPWNRTVEEPKSLSEASWTTEGA